MGGLAKSKDAWGWHSPLEADEAAQRLRQLGHRPAGDASTIVPTEGDSMAPVLCIEVAPDAPRGSRVNARLQQNSFARQFSLIVWVVLAVYALACAVWVLGSFDGTTRNAALVAIAGLWTFVTGLFQLMFQRARQWAGRLADVDGARERVRRSLSGL